MVGISPYRRRESHFNYFKSGGHQIIEIIETRSSVVPNPPNPGISIFQIIELLEIGPISILSIISIVGGPK